ncbi:MAG TPA: hypothetical protein VE242_14305 [Chthoniobacterales bacterium]|nr:hypothetical protein [Chthoniobacterales bacterium]
MARIVAPGLKALLDGLIDYAGMFPPTMLTRDTAVANYQRYRHGEHAWMLRWLVIGAAELETMPRELDGSLAVLTDTDQPRAAAIETKRIARAQRPVYCEVPLGELDDVKQAGCFAKLRTGGVKPEAVPAVQDVAAFIAACAQRRLPFKVTAGLHHPVRALQPLTYELDAPRAPMHGFLNVFLAAAFAWEGKSKIEPILEETDASAFRFDERARWRDWSLDAGQIREARQHFAHSFGSCSFDEPIRDLERLGLL